MNDSGADASPPAPPSGRELRLRAAARRAQLVGSRLSWIAEERRRAAEALARARDGDDSGPAWDDLAGLEPAGEPAPGTHGRDGDGVPFGLRAIAGWTWRVLIIAAGIYVLFWVLGKFTVLIVPVAIALLLVALVRPVFELLLRIRIGPVHLPRGLAALLTILFTLAVVVGLFTLIGQQIATGFSSLRDQAEAGLRELQDQLARGPLHLTSDQLSKLVHQNTPNLKANSGTIVSGAVQATSTAAELGTGFLLVLFTTYFFLSSGDRIWLWAVGMFPRGIRGRVNGAGRRAWTTLTSYVRATVLVAFADGLGVMITAALLHVPLPIPLGVLVFLGAFVPIIGALVSGSVAVLVALVAQGPGTALLMLLGLILVAQMESHLLQPFVMGRVVRVHPLAVILVIGAGVLLAGIPGALFAVPATAMANAAVSYLMSPQAARDEARNEASARGSVPDAKVSDPVVPEPSPTAKLGVPGPGSDQTEKAEREAAEEDGPALSGQDQPGQDQPGQDQPGQDQPGPDQPAHDQPPAPGSQA